MAKVQHIPRGRTFFTGRTRVQCGRVMDPDKVAPKGAPMCRICMRNSGWFTPMRKR